FFFSSRRRHTRSDRDWSSDVCSSDLTHARRPLRARPRLRRFGRRAGAALVTEIACGESVQHRGQLADGGSETPWWATRHVHRGRSEEHTSELQSRSDLVCRLLLEKKK